jgi:hypothetical protein
MNHTSAEAVWFASTLRERRDFMKRILLVCLLVLLSFAGVSLPQFTAGAQERVRGNRAASDTTQDGRSQKAAKKKGKGDAGGIRPSICNDCDPGDGGGGGGGGGSTGDGHIWCDGWDRQGDCAYAHLDAAAASAEFRRQKGVNGYDWQTFLSWFPEDLDGFGRMPTPDGNVGLVSTQPLPGQIPLHRWSTRKGFKYSVYYAEYGGDYVYGGVAGYVWPAGDNRGFPLYQFYSQEYGHFYTNYPRSEISCRPNVFWDFQGEICRVNWPAPASQALTTCFTLGPFPESCDPFFAERCRQQGGFFNFGNCTCQ